MYSVAYPLAVLATCVASVNAFMPTGPLLRAAPAPAISRARLAPLRMDAEVAVEPEVCQLLDPLEESDPFSLCVRCMLVCYTILFETLMANIAVC